MTTCFQDIYCSPDCFHADQTRSDDGKFARRELTEGEKTNERRRIIEACRRVETPSSIVELELKDVTPMRRLSRDSIPSTKKTKQDELELREIRDKWDDERRKALYPEAPHTERALSLKRH